MPDGSILLKGNYRAVISASDVVINGEPMTEDVIFDFFVTPGDANHDRDVDLADFNIVAANFGSAARDFTQGTSTTTRL